jgi:hypothetical protein
MLPPELEERSRQSSTSLDRNVLADPESTGTPVAKDVYAGD